MNGQKLRILREFRNYSQSHIACKLGISQNAYSRIENNQTKLTTERLQKLADILGVPPEELLSEKDPIIHFSFTGYEAASGGKEEHYQEMIENTRQHFTQVICSKDERIAYLENEINSLRKERKKIIQMIERLTS